MQDLVDQYLTMVDGGLDDETILEALKGQGAAEEILLMVNLAPVVIGRRFIGKLGATYSDEYLIFDPSGNLLEKGSVKDDPHGLVSRLNALPETDGRLSAVVLRSAETDAVNQALHAGSEPTDLVLAPPVFFSGPPTRAAVRKVEKALREMLKVHAPATPKPWWKFW